MLNPESRKILLDEIKPPPGYKLDRAVATTFSLDLLSLLMVPLSLSLFEAENKEEILKNPIAVMEALRRTSDKVAVFCQKGRIHVPNQDTRLYNYLEKIVHDVQLKSKKGVFHPKIWLMRFVSEDEPVIYRFLCLSRNITFDNSWDTILKLEGELEAERTYGFSQNNPLGDFIKTLPDLAVNGLNEIAQGHIDIMSSEVRKVRFHSPNNFDDNFEFIPIGIKGINKNFKLKDYTNMLVVSPFLSKSTLDSIFKVDQNNFLISRGETLDKFESKFIDNLKSKSKVYIFDDAAERPEIDDDLKSSIQNDLSGLHAKLYILEKVWDAWFYNGSANATRAALNGNNVEFMVGLKGKKSRVGIEAFLGKDEEATSLRNMFKIYQLSDNSETEDAQLINLENKLEDAQRKLSNIKFKVLIEKEDQETYSLKIKPAESLDFNQSDIEGFCYPITLLTKNITRNISPFYRGDTIIFNNVSISALTGFIAFNLKIKTKDHKLSTSFVLNLPTEGIPEDRDKKILQKIISNQERFIKYLLFLLSDEESLAGGQIFKKVNKYKNGNNRETINLPLLEELVRAYSRNPEKINSVKKLIEDLTDTEEGKKLLPKNFDKIWNAFMNAKKPVGELKNDEK